MLSLQQNYPYSKNFHLNRFSIKNCCSLILFHSSKDKTELELNPILEETLDEEIDLDQLEDSDKDDDEKVRKMKKIR